jgi:hypothetical protein
LQNCSLSKILKGETEEERMILFKAERELSINICINSKPLFLTKNELGEEFLIKMVVLVIWQFQNALKLNSEKTMDSTELVICASDYINRYSHDSVVDLIFALQQARYEGKVFYNKFSQQDFFEILNKHFEKKAREIEAENKSLDTNTNNFSLNILNLIEGAYFKGKEPTESLKVRLARDTALKQLETYANQTIKTEAEWEADAKQYSESLSTRY